MAGSAHAQFASTGTTTLQVTNWPEAALQIAATTNLTTAGTIFNANYTGTTNLTYKVRTTKSTGNRRHTLKGDDRLQPVQRPLRPNTSDGRGYSDLTCTLTSPGTGCSSSQTASTSSSTPVGTFGADAKSASAGNSGSVAWTLTDDPQYSTGTYTATVTFYESARR